MTHSPAHDSLQLVYKAAARFTSELYPDVVLPNSPSTPLIGAQSLIDSIGLIDFLGMVEEVVKLEKGVNIQILSEKAMSQSQSPLRDFSTLAAHVTALLAGGGA